MTKLSVDEILDAIKELSIIEAADLSKKIEEEFGIQAAAPMAVGTEPRLAVRLGAIPALRAIGNHHFRVGDRLSDGGFAGAQHREHWTRRDGDKNVGANAAAGDQLRQRA